MAIPAFREFYEVQEAFQKCSREFRGVPQGLRGDSYMGLRGHSIRFYAVLEAFYKYSMVLQGVFRGVPRCSMGVSTLEQSCFRPFQGVSEGFRSVPVFSKEFQDFSNEF